MGTHMYRKHQGYDNYKYIFVCLCPYPSHQIELFPSSASVLILPYELNTSLPLSLLHFSFFAQAFKWRAEVIDRALRGDSNVVLPVEDIRAYQVGVEPVR